MILAYAQGSEWGVIALVLFAVLILACMGGSTPGSLTGRKRRRR